MLQPRTMSVMCFILFLLKSSVDANTFVEWQSKLQRRALVKFAIKLKDTSTCIGLCWARMRGHGSSSVIRLSFRSIDDSDVRFADSSKTRGSTDEMRFSDKSRPRSRRRSVNTPS